MKQSTKLHFFLWLITGLNLTVAVTAFLAGSVLPKWLSGISQNAQDLSAALAEVKRVGETFEDLFHWFAFCALALAICWYLLVRECTKQQATPPK